MATLEKSHRLKKELSLFSVYAIATGTTLSAGFFLLPGLAAQQVGPALVICYLLAAVPLFPAMLSIVELATAMPRAGGVYYFLDRTMGPAIGTIGGLGTWFVLILKVAFALVGWGAYLTVFWPHAPVQPIIIGLAVVLTALNLFGTRRTGGVQVALVTGLLAIMLGFIVYGAPQVDMSRFQGFFDVEADTILATAGFVYVSYIGITTVVSLAEEVRDPERNLPRAIFFTLATALFVYAFGTAIIVGLVPMEELRGNLQPAALAGKRLLGRPGEIAISVAALLAFTSVANAGILSASRYPLAMSRDHLVPRVFGKLGWHRIPFVSVLFTLLLILGALVFLDPAKIAKLASTFQLLMFAMVCLAVIVMRESELDSYDPGFKSPGYPWMQLVGVVAPLYLISKMGWMPILFSGGLFAAGLIWYKVYARGRVSRDGAIFHVFHRLGRQRYEGLDRELRGILREKGLRAEDPFEEIVSDGAVLDLDQPESFETVAGKASELLAQRLPHESAESLKDRFLQGTLIGATPVTHGVALPHLHLQNIQTAEMVLVRAKGGVHIQVTDPLSDHTAQHEAYALFFLVSPDDDPALHLRLLAQIAERVEDDNFTPAWKNAVDGSELKQTLLFDEGFFWVRVGTGAPAVSWVGKRVADIPWPDGTLLALIRRGEATLIPRGSTVLEEGDRLSILGEPDPIRLARAMAHKDMNRTRSTSPGT